MFKGRGFRDEKKVEHPPEYSGYQAGPSSQPPQVNTYGCLLLSKRDRLRLLNIPNNAIDAVREAVKRAWPSGVQQEGPFHGGGYEFKLSGYPCELPFSSRRAIRC